MPLLRAQHIFKKLEKRFPRTFYLQKVVYTTRAMIFAKKEKIREIALKGLFTAKDAECLHRSLDDVVGRLELSYVELYRISSRIWECSVRSDPGGRRA